MNISEKFCLKWNDFQANVSSAFGSLRKENEFADVTLACEDGQQVEAHKVILAASSPFFQNLLKINNHQHPLIYMRGLRYEDLVAILDFLYHGEANIYQENLDSFLVIAEELKLKGLTGSENDEAARKPIENIDTNIQTHRDKKKDDSKSYDQVHKITEVFRSGVEEDNSYVTNNTVDLIENQVYASEIQELDDQIKSMMSKGETMCSGSQSHRRVSVCKVCGKEGQMTNIRNHIEANHIESIVHPCNYCDKTFGLRKNLLDHKSTQHKHLLTSRRSISEKIYNI